MVGGQGATLEPGQRAGRVQPFPAGARQNSLELPWPEPPQPRDPKAGSPRGPTHAHRAVRAPLPHCPHTASLPPGWQGRGLGGRGLSITGTGEEPCPCCGVAEGPSQPAARSQARHKRGLVPASWSGSLTFEVRDRGLQRGAAACPRSHSTQEGEGCQEHEGRGGPHPQGTNELKTAEEGGGQANRTAKELRAEKSGPSASRGPGGNGAPAGQASAWSLHL